MKDIPLRLAIWLLPPNRKAWGDAMASEHAHLPANAKHAYSRGCLWGSVKENLVTSTGLCRLLLLILALSLVDNLAQASKNLYWCFFLSDDQIPYRTLVPFLSNYVAPRLLDWFYVLSVFILLMATLGQRHNPKTLALLASQFLIIHLLFQSLKLLERNVSTYILNYSISTDWEPVFNALPFICIGFMVAMLSWKGPKRLAICALIAAFLLYFVPVEPKTFNEWASTGPIDPNNGFPKMEMTGRSYEYVSASILLVLSFIAMVIMLVQGGVEKLSARFQ